ncbi:hypothetical protein [Roseibium aggregatum]|uniref:hypothetical protein n=1 Tax=Roseibium aggregatum TaxID=187304 RepID=UPI000B0A9FCB|nr:hypothetical protein [Roseibium aggregatum]UFI04661.1 hypothetical protein ST40_005885 [Roseibium aggregatum]
MIKVNGTLVVVDQSELDTPSPMPGSPGNGDGVPTETATAERVVTRDGNVVSGVVMVVMEGCTSDDGAVGKGQGKIVPPRREMRIGGRPVVLDADTGVCNGVLLDPKGKASPCSCELRYMKRALSKKSAPQSGDIPPERGAIVLPHQTDRVRGQESGSAITASEKGKASPTPDEVSPSSENSAEIPFSGAVPVGLGIATVIRIPVPGTEGLAIEFFPRNYKGKTTSTLFIQDKVGKQHLRLDYGYNVKTKTIDYHWNQKSTHTKFGIQDHASVGRGGKVLYESSKYFRYTGRVLVMVGAVVDAYSIVKADKPLRRATAVVSAWASAWAGCKIVGAGGAYGGTAVTPGVGTAIGGVGGCIIGGLSGYFGGELVGEAVYDWAEGTVFEPLEQIRPAL